MKRIILLDTHIDRAGNILLQWRKQMSDDGKDWTDLDYHRALVPHSGDIAQQLALVDAHVKTMGFVNGVDAADAGRIRAHADLAWSDKLPLADDAVQARIDAESARQAEVAAALAARDDAVKARTDAENARDEANAAAQAKAAELAAATQALVDVRGTLAAIAAAQDASAPKLIIAT